MDKEKLYDYLLRVGIKPHLVGFSYLLSIIDLGLENPHDVYMTGLFIELEREFKKDKRGIEKAILTALNGAWKREEKRQFQYMIFGDYKRPTVKEFVCASVKFLYYRKNLHF